MKIIERTIILSCAAIFLFIVFKAVYNGVLSNRSLMKPQSSNYYQIIDKDFNKTVDVPFTDITSYRGNGNYIYMSVDQESPSLDNKIVQYNRKTQKYSTIFNSQFKFPSVQGIELNDNWLVWVDADESGGQLNPYFMNLKTKKIQPLTKENEENVTNDFPILIGDYATWIRMDRKDDKAEVMLKNLRTDETVSIFNLNSFTYSLSAKDGKILFTDKKDHFGYLYLYDVKSKEIKEYNSSYEFIGRARLLNDQQWVYLTFDDPSEPSTADEKLIFYDALTNHTQEVVSDIDSVSDLNTDFNNQLFLYFNENEYYKQFRIKDHLLVEDGWLEMPDIFRFSAENGFYIYKYELNEKGKLIIQSQLTN
ncbi:hypothetical protein C7Y47_16580 [Lysinibacillus sphaericus]|uniref:WD40 repeat domain-containing protein n=1 Tax=Lysinibacillus sphaericus TaxID=1421 RepID=A0A544UCR8_LYSSH|nr:hypothetical protein [Lysinibacillus sp. SDF0037]TQR30099.1 hypothetical protein C7Y47_16580 [Lysinibacillus sp. SDF0037]